MESRITFIIADNQDITRAGLHAFVAELFGAPAPAASRDGEDAAGRRRAAAGRGREPAGEAKACGAVTDVTGRAELTAALSAAGGSIVVIDYTLFDINGVEELLIIRARFPNARWIMFSDELSEGFVREMCAVDNVSIVMKGNAGEEIRAALVCAARGERYLCHQVTDLLTGKPSGKQPGAKLTPAETEILRLIAKGETVKEMAAERNSSVHTIITHKKNIFRKIGVNNIYEATKYALRAGLVEAMEYYI